MSTVIPLLPPYALMACTGTQKKNVIGDEIHDINSSTLGTWSQATTHLKLQDIPLSLLTSILQI